MDTVGIVLAIIGGLIIIARLGKFGKDKLGIYKKGKEDEEEKKSWEPD